MIRATIRQIRRLAMLFPAALSIFLIAAPSAATAQGMGDARFPTKPIKLIVPFAAGGSNDIVGRYIAHKLGDRMGQPVVTDNKAGANSIIGSQLVSEAPPDGYTLLIISNAFTTNPAVYKKLPYDPIKGFTMIAMIGTGPNVIAVWPGLGVNSVKELVALAKSKPGALHYASSGLGGVHNFTGELFKAATATDITHVAYRGGGPAMIDVMSGQVEVLVNTVASALGHIRSGKLKALAVDSTTRSSVLPGVPTISETVPGYEGNAIWWGILGPPNMPANLVEILNREINAVLKEPEVAKWLEAQSAEIAPGTPEQFTKQLTNEIAKYKAIAKSANIKID
jgi:tripartite-type tricarboxylate transporter receptor subunit TctC